MRWADDDDAPRRISALRPGTESGRRDRARVDDAGVRGDDELGRDAPVRPRALAGIANHRAQSRRVAGIEEVRDLRGMDVINRPLAHHTSTRRPGVVFVISGTEAEAPRSPAAHSAPRGDNVPKPKYTLAGTPAPVRRIAFAGRAHEISFMSVEEQARESEAAGYRRRR